MDSALLIIDIQNDYFANGKMALVGAEEASLNAGLILNKFRSALLPVIHIQHIANKPSATFFLPATKGKDIHMNVSPLKNEKNIIKHYPNSFRETELHEYLKSIKADNLVICGMMTHMCIDATVRAGKDFGYNIVLISDACATKDLEINGEKISAREVHFSFLAALNKTYADVKTTHEFLKPDFSQGLQPKSRT